MRIYVAGFLAVLLLGCATPQVAPQQSTTPSTYQIVQTKLGRTLRVSGPKYAPKIISRAEPLYPAAARAKGVAGLVRMETLIDTNGNVVEVRILDGLSDGLNEAAIDAVRQWKFAPTTWEGQTVPVLFEMYLNFRLG